MAEKLLTSRAAENQQVGNDYESGFGSMKGNSIGNGNMSLLANNDNFPDPEQDIKDIADGKYKDDPDGLYQAARRLLIAEFAHQVTLPDDVRKSLIDIVAGKGNYTEVSDGYSTVTPTEEVMNKAQKIINEKAIIEALVANSKPDNIDLMNESTRADDLQKWREKVLENYNRLRETAKNQVFDLETEEGAQERSNYYYENLKNLEIKLEKLKYKGDKIDNRHTRKGKDRREHKHTLKNTRDQNIQDIKDKYAAEMTNEKDLSDEMIGPKPADEYKDNIALNYQEKSKPTRKDIVQERKNIVKKRKGLGKFFGKIANAFRKVNVDTGIGKDDFAKIINPSTDFCFKLEDKEYRFNFAPITLNEITPLVTPRAKDSIVDTNTSTDENKNVYARINAIDNDPATPSTSNDALKQKYEEATANNMTNQDDVGALKKTWETDQKKEERTKLEEQYTSLYDLNTNWTDWNNKNKDKTGDEKEGKAFNAQGVAYAATRDDFYAWIAIHTPSAVDDVNVVWDEKEFKFKPKDDEPQGGKSTDDYDKEKKKYDAQKDKADELNKMIAGAGTNAQINGWDMDALKLKLLVDLSRDLISPQKWTSDNPGSAKNEVVEEFNEAGTVKEGKEKVDRKSTSTVRSFVEGQGVYNEEKAKRYGGFDEKSEEYIRKPEEHDDKVQEKLIWMINYKITIQEKTGNTNGH